jgi:hypothetical protein
LVIGKLTNMKIIEQMPKKLVISLVGIVLVVLLLLGGYFFYQYQILKNQLQASSVLTQQQTQQLLSNVGKLILLPHSSPTIFTVTDVKKLQVQPFFHQAKNGDRLLIYSNEQEAILYRPSQNMLIKVGPIAPAPQQLLQQATTQQVNVGLLNGTSVIGITTKVAQQIQKSDQHAIITIKQQAHNTNYVKTLVVVIHQTAQQRAQELATLLHAAMGSLPQGEIVPASVDVLIIVGKDKE